jgi:hypothetical protein
MPDATAPVAVQTSNEPTNKLATGTQAAGAIAGVLAGVLSAYGADAIKELLPSPPLGPATQNLIVMAVTAVATWAAAQWGGRRAAYNVLDKPNVPIAAAPSPRP